MPQKKDHVRHIQSRIAIDIRRVKATRLLSSAEKILQEEHPVGQVDRTILVDIAANELDLSRPFLYAERNLLGA